MEFGERRRTKGGQSFERSDYKCYYVSEGFTGTKGAVKPRSSLDVTDRRSVKSTDDEYCQRRCR